MLEVRNLKTYFKTKAGYAQAVDDVSFTIQPGENFGLVGESGCGKTTAAKSIIKLLPPNGEIVGGQILYKGRDLVKLTNEEMQKVRWKEISMISQSAMNSLDPVYRVGDQIVEAIQAHEPVSRAEAMDRAKELFGLVGIDAKRLKDYPHQFSGGMKQRSIIAMSLALNPGLIIADEPTTALDVIVQDQILRRIKSLLESHRASMILITHDISVVAEMCDRVAVMYAGKIMEWGDVVTVFKRPFHPYTLGLQNAFPNVHGPKQELISIPGTPPKLVNPPTGCRFAARCPFAIDRCREEEPAMVEVGSGHQAACHRLEMIDWMRVEAAKKENWDKVGVA
ncbi:MAG: ABC transporter ATP-binding protein [Sphingomonadaceae bacterium]